MGASDWTLLRKVRLGGQVESLHCNGLCQLQVTFIIQFHEYKGKLASNVSVLIS